MSTAVLEPLVLREVFAAYPSGVTAVAALREGRPTGLVASSFTSVSLSPPLVSLCFARTSRTWPELLRAPRLGVSVLGDRHEDACRQLAGQADTRFSGLDWRGLPSGAVVLDGAAAELECSVERTVSAGDHLLVLLRVHELSADAAVAPLVFHGRRYRRLAD